MGLEAQLKTINAGIKGVSIQQRKDSLVLVATLPAKVGDRKPHQQRIPTGHKADAHGLKLAHKQALTLASAKASGTFEWSDWTGSPAAASTPAERVLTVGEAVTQLEQDFWKNKIRTSAAERTWSRLKAETDQLPQAATLTMDLLVAVGDQQQPGSRTRQEALKVFKRLAVLVGVDGTDRLDAIKTPYEPGVRDIPSDGEVLALLQAMPTDHKYAWMTQALVIYGCRPAEIFSLRPQDDGTAEVLTIKRKGKLPTWRTALALPIAGLPALTGRSVVWDVKTPAEYKSLEASRLVKNWGKWLNNKWSKQVMPDIDLYDFRHAWTLRSFRKNLNACLAAKTMGHRLDVHHRTYHRWLEAADVVAVAASLQ